MTAEKEEVGTAFAETRSLPPFPVAVNSSAAYPTRDAETSAKQLVVAVIR